MSKTEQEIVAELAEAEKEWLDAKRSQAAAKKRWTESETKLVNVSVHMSRLKEELRVLRNRNPIQDPTLRELEIEKFRKDNPEIVEYAKLRDQEKGKDK